MYALDIGFAVVFLLVLVVLGTAVHEFLHAGILRLFGIPYTIEWFSVRQLSSIQSWVSVRWATVTPDSFQDISPWKLRLAAIAPLSIAAPVLLVGVGVLPNPFMSGTLALKMAVIASMACAIPSPDDFYLFWHADRVVAADDEYNHP